ncbi:MAG: hypothetical protein QXT38_02940 [Candidatus Aenigmatarchaeota archaeon]
MDEEEKRELIKSINEIRMEIGLQPYPLEHLESKSLEELRKLYYSYFETREDYRKRLKEGKPRFKLGLLIAIPIIAFLLILIIFPFGRVKERILGSSPVGEIENETITEIPMNQPVLAIYDFTLQSVFKDQANNYVLIIQNNGSKEIIFQKILIDDIDLPYKVLAGSYPPLKVGDIVYLQIQKQCDNFTHTLKIISENKTLEAELQAC